MRAACRSSPPRKSPIAAPAFLGADQIHQLLLAVHVELRVEMLRVTAHRVFREIERLCDIGFRAPFAQKLHDLELARREPMLRADDIATLVDAPMVFGRRGLLARKFGEYPLRVLVAHFEKKRSHHREREHEHDSDGEVVIDGNRRACDDRAYRERDGVERPACGEHQRRFSSKKARLCSVTATARFPPAA